jgi:hypothetical protein
MLAALSYSGFELASGVWDWVLGIGAPVLAAAIWGAFVAPKARWPVTAPIRLGIEFALFGAAAAGLVLADQPTLAIVLAVTACITSTINSSIVSAEVKVRTSPR